MLFLLTYQHNNIGNGSSNICSNYAFKFKRNALKFSAPITRTTHTIQELITSIFNISLSNSINNISTYIKVSRDRAQLSLLVVGISQLLLQVPADNYLNFSSSPERSQQQEESQVPNQEKHKKLITIIIELLNMHWQPFLTNF